MRLQRFSIEDVALFRKAALIGAGGLAVALVLLSAFGVTIRPLNAGLVFLLFTLGVSATFGLVAGLLVAVASNIVMSYFFLAPVHDWWVSDPQHMGALAVFVVVSAIGSSMLATARVHADEAEQGRAKAEALLQLNRVMIDQPDPFSAVQALCRQLQDAFGLLGVAVLVRQADAWTVLAASDDHALRAPTREEAMLAESAAERRPLTSDSEPGSSASRRVRKVPLPQTRARGGPPSRTSMLPLFMSDALLGTLRLDSPDDASAAEPEPQLLSAYAGEAALALHRLELARSAGQAEALRQADEVKTAILSSIAHDLKTPLATIKTSISSLLDESVAWSQTNRRSFLESIGDETDRLNKTISALLDLNRLESGAVRPILRTESLDQLVEDAIEQASGALKSRNLVVDVASLNVRTDGSLIRHALANLLENAALHSRPDGEIRVGGVLTSNDVQLTVEDQGPGIDREDLPFVFHRFYKGKGRGRATSGGTGLGLAIVKGFVTACGGSVEVESSRFRTRFTIHLPVGEVVPV